MLNQNTVTPVLEWPAFSMCRAEKQERLLVEMQRLTKLHMSACAPYQSVVSKVHFPAEHMNSLQDIPYIPVRLFKNHRLLSVPEQDIVKTMTSSGTSGHSPSQIFLEKYKGQNILLFGFTFVIWQNFLRELECRQTCLPLDNGILVHGGGWKKLLNEAVGNDEFKKRISQVTGISQVHNYYGMVEQTGSIFMECEKGHLHTSVWSDILIRDPIDFKLLPMGEKGLVQLLSVIPHSYPGHSILSEDVG